MAEDASFWGDQLADVYDDLEITGELETDLVVERLAELAAGGSVLELGVGTGRLAIPLAERGLEVHGIDASERMLEKLRERPGGEKVGGILADFSSFDLGRTFSLVVCATNNLFGLATQEEQLACFRASAAHLESGGLFVVETWVPTLPQGGLFRIHSARPDRLEISFWEQEPALQVYDSVHLLITKDGIRITPARDRACYPSELDLMGRLAGLTLRERWADWDRSPFAATSENHVSVYAKS
jgi:SAM-dependent methyltransferase